LKSIASLFRPPYKDSLIDNSGLLTRPWELFFRFISAFLEPLGVERYFPLENNISTAKDITGLSFNSEGISQAIVEFFIQRVTTGAGATELITSGVFHVVYKPTTNAWVLTVIGTPGPSVSGITFSITAAGQVQYTSTNITGTSSISKISYRTRTISGKSSTYSAVGK